MTISVAPHLNFRGEARAALEHYQSVFGGQLIITTYGDLGTAETPDQADEVVWGQVASDAGFLVMAYDVPPSRPFSRGEDPMFVSVRGTEPDELTRCWEALVEGGTVVAPLEPAAWSPLYGMLTDRFGITWVLDIAADWG